MPKATVPVARPAGLGRPAGFKKKIEEDEDEDEEKKEHPVLIVLASLILIICGYFLYVQYEIDQTFARSSFNQSIFGAPTPDDGGGSDAGDDYSDDGDDYSDDEDGDYSDEGDSGADDSSDEESEEDEEE